MLIYHNRGGYETKVAPMFHLLGQNSRTLRFGFLISQTNHIKYSSVHDNQMLYDEKYFEKVKIVLPKIH